MSNPTMRHSTGRRVAGIALISLLAAGCGSTGGGRSNEEPAVIPVIAVGTGRSPAEAREDAFLRAAEDVVGAYVFAETTLSDEEVREEIVNFRAGIIEDYVELGSEQLDDGRWSVKVLADVNTMPITSKLMTETRVTGGDLDGASLVKTTFARKLSRERFNQDARLALGKIVSGFPEDYLVLEESGTLSVVDASST